MAGRCFLRIAGAAFLVMCFNCAANGAERDKSTAERLECVQPHDIEPLKEGMTMVYSQDDAGASKWFSAQCYNTSRGELSHNCACFYWGFKAHSGANNSKAAQRSLDAALVLAPKDAKLRSIKGELFAKAEKFHEAADQFKLAAEYQDRDAEDADESLMQHYYNAATAYVQVRSTQEALQMYEEVLRTEAGAKRWAVHNSVGLIHYDLGKYEEAQSAYLEALDVEPDQPAVLRNLAGVYLMTERAAEAVSLLQISAAREPSSLEAWFYLGAAHEQRGHVHPAIESFRKAAAISPQHAEARRHLGVCCWEVDELGCAESELEAAVRIETNLTLRGGCGALSELGGLYLHSAMAPSAEEVFTRALQRCGCAFSRDPSTCTPEGRLLVELGLSELAQRKLDAANASLTAGIQQDPDMVHTAMVDLLYTRAALGDFDAAEEARESFRAHGQLWMPPEPERAAALQLPAVTLAVFLHQYAAERTEAALVAMSDGAVPLSMAWAGLPGGGEAMRVGVLVCSATLRGAHWAALKTLLRVRSVRGRGLALVLFDWCQESPLERGEGEEVGGDVLAAMSGEPLDHVTVGHVGNLSSWEAARRVNEMRVAALLVLDGWGARNKNGVLAHAPCPVQISALGGLSPALGNPRLATHMMAGRVSAPPELSSTLYRERLIYLPLGAVPPAPTEIEVDPPSTVVLTMPAQDVASGAGVVRQSSIPQGTGDQAPETLRSRARRGLSEDAVVLAVVGRVEELSREALGVWRGVLEASPAHVVLSFPSYPHAVQTRILAELGSGVAARVQFSEASLRLSGRLLAADVLLDARTLSAGPAIARAASLGKPAVTWPAEAWHARTAAEQLVMLGCSACGFATSALDYQRIATALAKQAAPSQPPHDYGELAEQWADTVLRGVLLAADLKVNNDSDHDQGWHHVVVAA